MHPLVMVIVVLLVTASVAIPGILLGRFAWRRWEGSLRVTPRAVSLTILVGSFALIVQSVGVYADWIPQHGPWFVLDAVLIYGYAVLTVILLTLVLPGFRNRRKARRGNSPPPTRP